MREGEGDKEILKGKSNFFNDWIVPLLVAIVLAILINKYIIFKVMIPSGSMIPTLNVDDRLFATRVYRPERLNREDIIVFYSDELEKTLIKRLIGLPGDKVVITDGDVTVNGEKLKQEYVKNKDSLSGTYLVPEGKYFFLGDNRLKSSDSRDWDNPYIDESDIKGKAQVKVYPFSDFSIIK